MRHVIFLVAAACAFGAAPLTAKLGTVGGSLALVALGVGMAIAASGGAFALAAAGGAVGAFTFGLLSPVSAVAGGAALVALAYAERSSRVRGSSARAAHVVVGAAAGAIAGWLSVSFTTSSVAVRAVAIVVAAVLVALPLLIDPDDVVAHALDGIAKAVGEPSRAALHDSAELRRTARDVPLDASTHEQVKRTWCSLSRLAEARLRLEGGRAKPSAEAVRKMVDQRIVDHLAVLARAYTATLAADAAKVGIDDAALRSMDQAGEHLEELSSAMVETSPHGDAGASRSTPAAVAPSPTTRAS